jgi:hypothetical protein
MRLRLLPAPERAALDETRSAPFRKADVDDIEVAGNNGLGKDGPGLSRDLRSEVAVREVDEGQHLHACGARELGRVDGGRVQRLVRPLPLGSGEGGLVHEHVRFSGGLEHGAGGARISGQRDLPPRPWGPKDVVRGDRPSVREDDRLAGLEAAVQRPLGDPEGMRRLEIEAPRPRRLHERVAVGGNAVLDIEDSERVVAAVEHVARPKLDELEVVRELPEHASQSAEEVD